jgi:hypothetical protein
MPLPIAIWLLILTVSNPAARFWSAFPVGSIGSHERQLTRWGESFSGPPTGCEWRERLGQRLISAHTAYLVSKSAFKFDRGSALGQTSHVRIEAEGPPLPKA